MELIASPSLVASERHGRDNGAERYDSYGLAQMKLVMYHTAAVQPQAVYHDAMWGATI